MTRKTIIRGSTVILLIIVLLPFGAWVAAEGLIVRSAPSHADAVVVLAGSATYLERVHHAAQLFNAGRAPLIVLTNDNVRSGWSVEQQSNPLFVEKAVDELKRQGVPAGVIEILPGPVSNTYDEALRVRDHRRDGWRSLVVVTSAYQSRRALWTMRRVFQGEDIAIQIDPAPVGEQSPSTATWWCYRLGWKLVPGEYAKIIYYRIRY